MASTSNGESSNASIMGGAGSASVSIDTESTKASMVLQRPVSALAQYPSHALNPRVMSYPQALEFKNNQYNRAWESLSESQRLKQLEYDSAITAISCGKIAKRQKRKNIFQIGRRPNSISSSQKRFVGCGSSGSSSENAPINNYYTSVLLSSSNGITRKEPRPSSVHGHLGGHHAVSKSRRHTESGAHSSGTESGGSSGSSTREFVGNGRGTNDSEDQVCL